MRPFVALEAPTPDGLGRSEPSTTLPAVRPDLTAEDSDGVRILMDEVDRGEALPAEPTFDELHPELTAWVRAPRSAGR